ncbi:MAG: carbon-nitrogen hydrolase family protein [Ruminococcus sp.]|nr:carbon-nitrogen hydrolase family protein [Ruminococcus sp.]
MNLAMAQIQVSESVEDNLQKTLRLIKKAKRNNADLIFFPEVQLSPFFPQYENKNADMFLMTQDSPEIKAICQACKESKIYASPNVYLSLNGKKYDASLMIDDNGKIIGISKMVYIAQAQNFYEQDYYTPSDDGFKVYDTPFGKIGIVICFDRHMPESIRKCSLKGAELILIPTANLKSEPMELFEWEVRIQAFQNLAYVAMCNRVGREGNIVFCGQSLVAKPDGSLLFKTDDKEELILLDIDLSDVAKQRSLRPWLKLAENNSFKISDK